VVSIDAAIECPTVGVTTTTRRPDFDLASLRKAEQALWRWLRRQYGPVRYLAFLEWTTGRGTRSGGHRRPHLHHLVKGLPSEIAESGELERELAQRWHRFTGDAFVVECRPLRSPAGAINYLALHHHKREQAPPAGLANVKRFRPSKGYFTEPLPALRETAAQTLRDEHLAKAVKRAMQTELLGEAEFEVNRGLQDAIAAALRSLLRRPSEAQLNLEGGADRAVELAELARRACSWVRRQEAAYPAELVNVAEAPVWNEDGRVTWQVVCVLGTVRS